MNISDLTKIDNNLAVAKSTSAEKTYFHRNFGFMIVGYPNNWKDVFWLEEDPELEHYYLHSAPYDDDGEINLDHKQIVVDWYGIHEFQKRSLEDEDRRISEIWHINDDLLNMTYRYRIANLKNLIKI